MTDDQSSRDRVQRLTDALCEDILTTPGDELLDEVAEDYGDRRALATEFERIFEGVVYSGSRFRRLMGLISNSRIRPEVTPRTIHDVMELRSPRLHEGSAPDRQGLQDMEPIKVAPVPEAFLPLPALWPKWRMIAAFALALMFTCAMFFVFLAAEKEQAARVLEGGSVLKAGKPAITTTRDGVYGQY
jgi:hypothetical protein